MGNCQQHDCTEALTEIYTFLDGELDDAKRKQIQLHIEHCSPCLEAFDFENDLKRLVQHKCRDTVPEGLRDRIAQALGAEHPGA